MEKLYQYRHNPIVKKIFFAMLIPTILMNLTTAIASFADTVIIGYYLDDKALSVVTFATPIFMIINTFGALFAVGGSIAMGIDSGKGDKAGSNEAFSLSIELMAVVGGLLILAGVFFIDQITVWLGAEADVFDLVRSYSLIILAGAPIFMLNIGLAFFIRNDGRPILSMVGMFTSIGVDLILNFVFVGFMDMGVNGAALSTVLGQVVSVLILGSHFLSSKNTLRFKFVINGKIWRIIKNGASSALHFVYQFLTVLIMNHFVVSMAGTNGVVVYTVVFNLYTVSLALFEGLSQTVQPMASLYYGEKSNRKIKNTVRLALIGTFIMCGAVTLILELVPQAVPIAFGIEDLMIVQDSVLAVRIFATSLIIMTVNVIIGYYLQSTEQTRMSAVLVSLRGFVLFLASAFVLGKLFGMNGVWGAYTMAEVLGFMICFVMIQEKRKKLSKENIKADVFLLNTEIERSTNCYTFDCKKDDFTDFRAFVLKETEGNTAIGKPVFLDMEQYLKELEKCIAKGRYIEVEINEYDRKVMIRDDLDHSVLKDGIMTSLKNGSKAEYGPVLGWNRICLQ